jgi:hypothetical protein
MPARQDRRGTADLGTVVTQLHRLGMLFLTRRNQICAMLDTGVALHRAFRARPGAFGHVPVMFLRGLIALQRRAKPEGVDGSR